MFSASTPTLVSSYTSAPNSFSSLNITYGCSGVYLSPIQLPHRESRFAEDDFDVVFTGGVPLSRQTTPMPRTRSSSPTPTISEASPKQASGSAKGYKRALKALSIKSGFSSSLASLRKF